MIKYLLIFLLFIQEEVPLKPNEEFEIKLDYKFKQRNNSVDANYKVDFSESKADYDRRTSTNVLPYLSLNIKMLKLSEEEIRIKGVALPNGKTLFSKKVVVGEIVKMELGFTDDLKDHVTPHEYNILLLSSDKKEISRIHLMVKDDGTFLINEQVRGKF